MRKPGIEPGFRILCRSHLCRSASLASPWHV
jgi:hypothetical protein